MPTTQEKIAETFKQSLAFSIPKKMGLATGHQVFEWVDCLHCIRNVCSWTLDEASGWSIPEHWQARINAIPKGSESLATIAKTLNLWRKWTYPHQVLTSRQVQEFLYELTR